MHVFMLKTKQTTSFYSAAPPSQVFHKIVVFDATTSLLPSFSLTHSLTSEVRVRPVVFPVISASTRLLILLQFAYIHMYI